MYQTLPKFPITCSQTRHRKTKEKLATYDIENFKVRLNTEGMFSKVEYIMVKYNCPFP